MRASSVLFLLAGSTFILAACDRPSDQRLEPHPSVSSAAIKAAPDNVTPPPLPLNTDVNAAVAENQSKSLGKELPSQPDKDGANQATNVAAQDAAAKAPDTASGDEARKQVLESASAQGGSEEGNVSGKKPPGDELTKSEESTAMPTPGQANDHSTLAPPQK